MSQPDCVIENRTVPELYRRTAHAGARAICPISSAGNSAIDAPAPDLGEWTGMLARMDGPAGPGQDRPGRQVCQACMTPICRSPRPCITAGYEVGCFVDIDWVDSEDHQRPDRGPASWRGADGIILPGGFGARGIPGMLCAANYARVHGIPYFGICLGMQIAVMSYARFGSRLGRCKLGRI